MNQHSRFRPADDLSCQHLYRCYSHVGRRGNGQTVSLSRQGCIYYGTVQHELLHTLGFNHEHSRSDRDQHIQVLLQNVVKGRQRDEEAEETTFSLVLIEICHWFLIKTALGATHEQTTTVHINSL